MEGSRKRIAVFVGQADENYQSKFLSGMFERAFSKNMDACVFSMYRKYQFTEEREKGESNIFSLMNPALFEGVVILKDTIQTPGLADAVEERVHTSFRGPVLVIEKESRYYDSICVDDYEAIKELVNHLIQVHGYKKIAFLSGKKFHPHSQNRLRAFMDAMLEHGLTVREDWLFDGDFWYTSGEQCADYLISLKEELPEAVVCANDQMAIGLCEAFEKRNIFVPADIAVIGYDSIEEGQTSPKTITSAELPAEECGRYAADYMNHKINGGQFPEFQAKPKMMIGESCGCSEGNIPERSLRRKKWSTENSEVGFRSIYSMMEEEFFDQVSLMEFLSTVYSYVYQLRDVESFHLCICSQWKYLKNDGEDQVVSSLHVKNDGYPEKMIYAIRYNKDRKENQISLTATFPTGEMLPELSAKRDEPCAFFFTPVYCGSECFGYAALSYGNTPRSYDDIYRMWIGAVARGFEEIRRYCILQTLSAKVDRIHVSKFDMGNAAYENLSKKEREEYELVGQILDENLLTYYFQPIVRTTDGSIYSYEALMRTTTNNRISPLAIIKYAGMQGRLSDVERATFLNVLKIVNEKREVFWNKKVFINSIPGVKLYETDFKKVEEYLERNADVAVVELTEEAELSDEDLEKTKEFYQRIHVETAVDDYGTGYSNISNLLRYMPNYVKIDRSLLSEIQNKPQKQHFVREIIEYCHDNHIMALAEGVETTEELQMVIHLGADLIQGYYTAKPSAEIISEIDKKVRNEIKTYFEERQDGAKKHIYIAGKTNRVSLAALVKDGCTDIVVGSEEMVYQDIEFIGMPSVKTNLHIFVESGYHGRITLENAHFSNVKNRPCIELSESTEVILVLRGDNVLKNSGIQVPEHAKLVFEGDGNLTIRLNEPKYYGIGNHLDARHGELVFHQDGKISIRSSGMNGVCIGSGKGGKIKIDRGQYVLEATGEMCVGIGAVSEDVSLELCDCLVNGEFNVTKGVGFGSFRKSLDFKMVRSSLLCYGGASLFVAIGTMTGENARISITESSMDISIRSDSSTCFGALHGSTEIYVGYAGVLLESAGKEALAFGGPEQPSKILLRNANTKVELHNSYGKDTYAKEEDFVIINGRRKFLVNDEEIERELIFKNE